MPTPSAASGLFSYFFRFSRCWIVISQFAFYFDTKSFPFTFSLTLNFSSLLYSHLFELGPKSKHHNSNGKPHQRIKINTYPRFASYFGQIYVQSQSTFAYLWKCVCVCICCFRFPLLAFCRSTAENPDQVKSNGYKVGARAKINEISFICALELSLMKHTSAHRAQHKWENAIVPSTLMF